MPGKKTLGSMMNPQPMQFTMGAKMYQNGVGSVDTPMLQPAQQRPQGLPGMRPAQQILFEKFRQGYMPQTLSEMEMYKKYKSMDFVTPGTRVEEEVLEKKGKLGDDELSLDEKLRRIRERRSSAGQTPPGVPAPDPRDEPAVKSNAMGRLLKEYLKGGKTEAGLRALAASNPNLTYKEATSGMRLIKDPVGMKSAGHGRKMYQNGVGDASYDPYGNVRGDVGKDDPAYMGANKPGGFMYRDDLPEGRIDANDPGFQEFLKNYGGEYFEEYHGMPIGGSSGGGAIYGQTSKFGEINPDTGRPYERGDRSAGYFDVLGGKHGGDMMHDLAVNPAMFAFDIEDDRRSSFLNKPLQGGREGATNRDLAMSAIERYNKNLAAEQAYRDYLAKQQGPTEGGKSYRTVRRPGESDAFIVTE